MKIVHIIKQDPDVTTGKIILEHKKDHDVTVIDLRENKQYELIVDLIADSDKVICW